MAWREKVGWQVEGFANYGPTMVILWLTTGRRIWYVVGSYVPPNSESTVAQVGEALGKAAKGVEVLLLGDLNVRLQEPRDTQEEELATVVAACGLVDMKLHFMLRRRYRGDGRCTWMMRREDRQVTGRGGYILCTNRHNFFNARIREARMNTYHRMVLAVLRGEGAHRNGGYQRRRICWTIKHQTVRPLTDGEA